MMERSLMKQRAGIVQRQVAAGREFRVNAAQSVLSTLFSHSFFLILSFIFYIFIYCILIQFRLWSVHCRVVHFTVNLKSLCSRCVSHMRHFYSLLWILCTCLFIQWLFYAVCFQDFDVGKSYKKKILLTNISYTQNFCKYVGMSYILKDFIEVL